MLLLFGQVENMHELAITESILKIVQDEAKKHNAKKVLEIKLKIGVMSGVMPLLIQEYFNIASRDTIADGAKLTVENVPVTIKCLDCSSENVIDRMKIKCPVCGSINIQMTTGREFYIDSMEVE